MVFNSFHMNDQALDMQSFPNSTGCPQLEVPSWGSCLLHRTFAFHKVYICVTAPLLAQHLLLWHLSNQMNVFGLHFPVKKRRQTSDGPCGVTSKPLPFHRVVLCHATPFSHALFQHNSVAWWFSFLALYTSCFVS